MIFTKKNSKCIFIILPVYFTNRWNENMAVKRDVHYVSKGYDFKTKIKDGGSFQMKMTQFRVSLKSAPNVSVYELKLQYHSSEKTVPLTGSFYSIFHHDKLNSRCCCNAVSTVLFLAQRVTQKKAHTFNCTDLRLKLHHTNMHRSKIHNA